MKPFTPREIVILVAAAALYALAFLIATNLLLAFFEVFASLFKEI